MTNSQMLLNAVGGVAASWLTVLLTRARATVLQRARVAKVLSVVAGVVVAITAPEFDGALVANQTSQLAVNALLAILAGHTTWKTWLQPQIEQGQGLAATLSTKTAGFGVGGGPAPS